MQLRGFIFACCIYRNRDIHLYTIEVSTIERQPDNPTFELHDPGVTRMTGASYRSCIRGLSHRAPPGAQWALTQSFNRTQWALTQSSIRGPMGSLTELHQGPNGLLLRGSLASYVHDRSELKQGTLWSHGGALGMQFLQVL